MSTLIFDCDGVLADTERFGHLPAFNQTFREFGLPVQWSEDEYGQKLLIAGGKERMASLLTPEFVAANARIGRLFNWDSVTLCASSLFSVLRREASAVTVTDSEV